MGHGQVHASGTLRTRDRPRAACTRRSRCAILATGYSLLTTCYLLPLRLPLTPPPHQVVIEGGTLCCSDFTSDKPKPSVLRGVDVERIEVANRNQFVKVLYPAPSRAAAGSEASGLKPIVYG